MLIDSQAVLFDELMSRHGLTVLQDRQVGEHSTILFQRRHGVDRAEPGRWHRIEVVHSNLMWSGQSLELVLRFLVTVLAGPWVDWRRDLLLLLQGIVICTIVNHLDGGDLAVVTVAKVLHAEVAHAVLYLG